MRATSIATLPAPITTAVSASKGVSTPTKSGCALYQGTKTAADNAAGLDTVRTSVEELVKASDAKIAELDKKYNEISEVINSLKEGFVATEKRIDAVESDTAIKKSADLGGSKDEPINKSKWGGTFLGVRNEL